MEVGVKDSHKLDVDTLSIHKVQSYNRVNSTPVNGSRSNVNKQTLPKGSTTFQQVLDEIEKEKEAERKIIEKTLSAFTMKKKPPARVVVADQEVETTSNMGSGISSRTTPRILLGFRKEIDIEQLTTENTYVPVIVTSYNENAEENEASDKQDVEDDKGFVQTGDSHCKRDFSIFGAVKVPFNINAHHGGCCSLLLSSGLFGEKGDDTSAAAILFGSGFDCNHLKHQQIYLDTEKKYGLDMFKHVYMEDEAGNLVIRHLFTDNHCRLLTNDCRYGNLRNGVFVEAIKDKREVLLPLNVNGNWKGESGGGMTMLLCSGIDDDRVCNAVYMIKSGDRDNNYRAKILTGDDKFTFELRGECLAVIGPHGSKYSLFHNRNNLTSADRYAFVAQLQIAEEDNNAITLLQNVPKHATVLVLCSNSNGTEDCTVSAIYFLAVRNSTVAGSTQLAAVHGTSYTQSDLWTFQTNEGRLEVLGPSGPCKYGVLTNISVTRADLESSCKQTDCIATGEATKTYGKAKITDDGVFVEINKISDIILTWNYEVIRRINKSELKEVNDVFTFEHKWETLQKEVGLHLVRVYAVRKHVNTGQDVNLELAGSPQFLTYQKPGVLYALNVGSQTYQAENDVIYSGEFSKIINYDYSNYKGFTWKCFGVVNSNTELPASISRSEDGFLYATMRCTLFEGELGKTIDYKKQKRRSNCTAYTVDVDVPIEDGSLSLKAFQQDPTFKQTENVCAFALFDKKTYVEKIQSKEQKQQELNDKIKIAETAVPLSSILAMKRLKNVGWSKNLLQNASAESGDLEYWNISGRYKITPGGYNTVNCIETSDQWFMKYQEVNLSDYFSAEYLDTAPAIETLTEYTTGEIGTINADKKWQKASNTFTNYGTGVRIVAVTSKGKDDKGWDQSYHGVKISSAEVRVKRKLQSPSDDIYEDINFDEINANGTAMIDKVVNTTLSDNIELIQEYIQDSDDNNSEEQTTARPKSSKVAVTVVKRRRKERKKREIRVFVSSTFRDFQKEREEIIKKAFREINRICADRGVFFTYVDLRWGITSEQTSDGKTIAICLQEIERCRPYFICLMGERFGWSQKTGSSDEVLNMTFDYAIEHNPSLAWVKDYRYDTSVTQLEILHGALNSTTTDGLSKCFFYLREPFTEGELPEDEYKRVIPESEWHKERQEALKSEVKKRPHIKCSTFKYPSEVAELIMKDLEACIDKDFPVGTELTKLEIQREAHIAFAAARTRIYIGSQAYFDTINEYRSKKINQPFVVKGESGSGKSAFVANWCKRIEESKPETFMFVHFIGSSADSASYLKMLRRLFEELKDGLNLDLLIPTSDAHLINDVSKWLKVAGSRSNIIIVFDALNQLDDGAGQDGTEHDLAWLPQELPPNVFMLLSTLPGRAMDACGSRGWPSMNVHPLDDSQKSKIITDYLEGIYAKTLTQDQKDMIVNAKQTSNALYLKSLLDEVRMYGSFRTLSAKIQEYLTAESPGDLFAKILERLEVDFEQGDHPRPYLVRDATALIWCSSRGMSEAEIIEILDVSSAVWSPFYLSLYENLVNRDGILNFFHDHLRQAVEKKYLSKDNDKKACYLKLADYFEKKELSSRKVEELPTLLTKACEWDRLKSTISDLDFFYKMEQDEGPLELVKAWKSLGDFSLSVDAYARSSSDLKARNPQKVADHPEYYISLFSKMGNFFEMLGLMNAAKNTHTALLGNLEALYKASHSTIVYSSSNHSWKYKCNHPDVIETLQDLGSVYCQLGEYDKAIENYKDAINRVTKQDPDKVQFQRFQLCEGLVGLGTVYIEQGRVADAEPLMIRALELAVDIVGLSHPFTAAIFTKMGDISYKQGQIEKALAYHMQNLKVIRGEVGTNHPRIANMLNEIGLVYDELNDPRAGNLYEAALTITRNTYGDNHIGTASIRYNLGAFYLGCNYFSKAKYQFKEAYKVLINVLGQEHPNTVQVKKAIDTV
ncbi:hypothetical protein ACF0H5_005057 [Mactra antiquata]